MKKADQVPCVRFVNGSPVEIGRAVPSPWKDARRVLGVEAVGVEEVRGIGYSFIATAHESARIAWNRRSA
jgi:hypothetical protein